MKLSIKSIVWGGMIALANASIIYAADVSPAGWPKAERERLEKLESETLDFSPTEAQSVESSGGIVSATVSPVSAYAGIQTLKHGGNAADAAATIALTQVTTQLGSVVSYAGVFTMLYYDAKAHKVYSMDAGYNSYLEETDPKSIPVSNLHNLDPTQMKSAAKPSDSGDKGRETLVPGFMIGVEAMHTRFGRLPFPDLFAPAIWYAEHGIRISHPLYEYFTVRAKYLSRTPEGKRFLHQAGDAMPEVGDLFVQADLTATLKAVSEQGSRYMYTGQWEEDFVRIVQREGGKVTPTDLTRYKPIWSEPFKETAFGRTVYVNGPPDTGALRLFLGLNLAEALELDERGPYWTDAETFRALAQVGLASETAPAIGRRASDFLRSKGIDISPKAQMGKAYARALAPIINEITEPPAGNEPKHSNAIVVVDKDGNIAVITHTINGVIWGDTGIVVDGIPIPDSAGFQQRVLAGIKPGDPVPNPCIDTIAFDGDKPILATAAIGASENLESIRVLLDVLGRHQNLATVMSAPPLLESFGTGESVPIPQGAYTPHFIARLKESGLNVAEIPTANANALRGTLAAVAMNPTSGERTAVNQPRVMVFNAAER